MARLLLPVSARDHTLGPPDAATTLVEYGQYECSHCAQVEPIVREVRRRLNGTLRFVYRHFPPARFQTAAQRAAEAAEAAAAQGQFWQMHRRLFEQRQTLDDATISLCAAALGLDMPRFLHDLEQHVYAERVHEDFESGLRSGVSSTPTFYINGVRHDDYWDADTLLAAIERHLSETEDGLAGSPPQLLRTVA